MKKKTKNKPPLIVPEDYKDSDRTVLLKIDINQAKELQSAIEDVKTLSMEIDVVSTVMEDLLTDWDKMSEDKMFNIGTLGRIVKRLNDNIWNNLDEFPSEIDSLMHQLGDSIEGQIFTGCRRIGIKLIIMNKSYKNYDIIISNDGIKSTNIIFAQ